MNKREQKRKSNNQKVEFVLDEIFKRVEYCPKEGSAETGFFRHSEGKTSRKVRVGNWVKGMLKDGYRQLKFYIDGCLYCVQEHNLIWRLETGSWPEFELDHRNKVTLDNRIENLRCDPFNNFRSQSDHLPGAYYKKVRSHLEKPWEAEHKVNGKKKYLGHYHTEEEAHSAWLFYVVNYVDERILEAEDF